MSRTREKVDGVLLAQVPAPLLPAVYALLEADGLDVEVNPAHPSGPLRILADGKEVGWLVRRRPLGGILGSRPA